MHAKLHYYLKFILGHIHMYMKSSSRNNFFNIHQQGKLKHGEIG